MSYLSIGVLILLILIVIPIPLGILIILNLVLAILLLLTVLKSKKPSDFSLFPIVILLLTIFNLMINISAARLILTKRTDFDGFLIRLVSSLFAGSSDTNGLVFGSIFFIAIIVAQIVIVTKGVVRVAEVAERFTLDSCPGKQMAIDAEYSSGVIDQKEAESRKEALQREIDFYYALDGVTKFFSINEKLRVFTIVVTVIGGILLGVLLDGISLAEAVKIFIPLIIGSGFLTILPAFLTSTAIGIAVTRSAYDREAEE